MNWHRINRLGLIVGIAALVVAACGGTSNTTSNWKTATSAASGGGMDALVAAAKAEGQLNVIALPHDWTNYGEIISTFKSKYPGINVNEISPNDGSQQEVDKITSMGTRGPDVVDVGTAVALKSTSLFTPYQVQTWNDIPTT